MALDPDAFHFYQVKAQVIRRRFVEPFDHLPMFLHWICRNPDCDVRVQVHQVSENLAEMTVIGFFKLILDDDLVSKAIFSIDVDPVRSDIAFYGLDSDIHINYLVEVVDVICKPPREIGCFPLPYFTKINFLNSCDRF